MKLLKEHKSFNGQTQFFEHQSEFTETTMKFSVYKPDGEIKGGLIWLSGLTCNEENFITKAGAQKLLSELGLMLICPDTSPRGLDLPGEHESYDFGSGAGFYVNAETKGYADHYQMYDYINDEIYTLINAEYKLNGNISIMGHSMGGHGALILGLHNPKKYKSISAFSPITQPTECAWGKKAFKGYLGADETLWKSYDACTLVEEGAHHPNPILIEQGLNDEFYPDQLKTKNFEQACSFFSQKLQVNYRDNFDHSYYFIASFIDEHIKHHAKYLL